MILVIVIIGVLGALAGPRFFNNQAFAERAYAEELASALRYAQKVAVGSGCRVRVSVSAIAYELAQQAPQSGHCNPADAGFPVDVMLSSGQAASGNAPSGVVVSPAATLVFDALGRTGLAANLVLGVGVHTLSVEAGSGLVRGPQ
ncbi:MAG: GspH/FimT family pseudopilin [Halioglobus sp.]|nr:GspH/FimT family pseudopilin [Halioglobus sp.]